ncbi:right-handed parallel beta-helix repeat-containing protein [Tahibacter amnicola]|uniref:Right-handed parallel beta-helix repeat-containing protein n=1 Tax=Tahibacter amnicola TaxID=2976241 RepID=A0ABY6BKM4_9GAMM|nr:right-handed parallel beta-helix repeat-containing protein [Tahibacter amnicola]UXI70564.1 right-handed parallel beta-helix repeat-containing protein [Tahibacter amnicola]
MRHPIALLLILLAAGAPATAATYRVGPSQSYTNLNQLFAAVDLGPGDVVEVDGGVIYDVGTPGVIVPQEDGGAAGNPVILRGIRINNQRPHLRGGTNTIEFRLSNHVVFEGFEVSGTGNTSTGTFRCVYHHAHDIVIRDAYIHDCPRHGILGADNDSGSLTVEYSEVFNAGSNGGNHAIYMATDEIEYPGAVFRLQYSYIHDSQFGTGEGGNLIKSRAERNEIYYNWLEGGYYHELELIGPDPDGGVPEDQAREDSDVVGNVIVHTSDFGAILRFGGDATGQSFGRYRFVNNTVVRLGAINDVPTVFRLFDGIESLAAYNNVLWRDGANALRVVREVEADWATGSSQIIGSNNWIDNGSTFIPAGFSATTLGATPGFVDSLNFDYRPAAGSPLLNAGNGAVTLPSAYAISNPLFPPAFHPPARTLIPVGTAAARVASGAIDVGAFELASDVIFANGFQ